VQRRKRSKPATARAVNGLRRVDRFRHQITRSRKASKATPQARHLAVYDGRTCVGHLLMRGRAGVEAFDRDDNSLGVFASASDAANAVTTAAQAVTLSKGAAA
jgi:hypothetical protein